MTTNSINAATNPDLANKLISEVMEEDTITEKATIVAPSDTLVTLPGGFMPFDGEVIGTAEVRELTGKDEEAIARASSLSKALLVVLSRGVVSIGDTPADDKVLDQLLAGDRDSLMLGIYRATFGSTAEVGGYCIGCQAVKLVEVDTYGDIKTKVLVNPADDRTFTVKGKVNEYLVTLPTGTTQKQIINSEDKNVAELNTILLENTVLKINDASVYNKVQVQNLPITDRKKILEAIAERNPGPQFDDIVIECPDCGGEVAVPIDLGTLFQF